MDYSKKYYFIFKCMNKKCSAFKKETEPIHSDNLTSGVHKIKVFNILQKREEEFPRLTCTEGICKECNYQMEERYEETKEVLKDYKYQAMSVTNKKSKKYWTRYKTVHGGVPEFNPVSENNGDGGGKVNPLD